jgi:hypothetical protein
MDHSTAPEKKAICPIDAGVEWAINSNIGLFVGYFSAKLDTPSGPNYILKFVWETSLLQCSSPEGSRYVDVDSKINVKHQAC